MKKLKEIPKCFALGLMEACVSPSEIARLMHLTDHDTDNVSNAEHVDCDADMLETVLKSKNNAEHVDCDADMLETVLKSKNKELIKSPVYRSMILQKAFGGSGGEPIRMRYVFKRFLMLIFLNLFYPVLFVLQSCSSRTEWKSRFSRLERQFFSVISAYKADVINYLILFVFLILVTLDSVPDNTDVVAVLVKFNKSLPNTTTARQVIDQHGLATVAQRRYLDPEEWGRRPCCIGGLEVLDQMCGSDHVTWHAHC